MVSPHITLQIERRGRAVVLVLLSVLASLPCRAQVACPGPFTGTTTLISATPSGGISNGHSFSPDVNAHGDKVVFSSSSGNLLPGDTNGSTDIYLANLTTRSLYLVSQNSMGVIGNGACGGARITADGHRIVYWSDGTNLVTGDVNGSADIFISDWERGTTRLASVGSGGIQGNGDSLYPTVSSCGRWIAFSSLASNLVPGDTNGAHDAFVRDDLLGVTERVSLSMTGSQIHGSATNAVVSGNGRFVAFASGAPDVVPGDTNGLLDAFIRDRILNTTILVSRSLQGTTANGHSGPSQFDERGSLLLFGSYANNLVVGDTGSGNDIFLFEVATQAISRISLTHNGQPPDAESFTPSITRDGRFVCFGTEATNVLPGDTNNAVDSFLVDLLTGAVSRLTVNTAGCEPNRGAGVSGMSDDARFVAMDTTSDNLSPEGNPQHRANVYLRDQAAPGPHTYCQPNPNSQACVALISALGVPSASATSGFTIAADGFTGAQPVIFFYGSSSPAALPFGPALLCVQPPLRRTTPLASTGSPGGPCDGTASFDFNTWRSQGHDPLLTAGTTVWGQFWIRDPNGTGPRISSTSDAVVFMLTP